MFQSIADIVLKHLDKMSIVISGTAEKLVVAVFSDPKKDGPTVKPIIIRGTAAEVEEQFAVAIQEVFAKNDEVYTNLATVAAEAKEQEAAAKKKSTTTAAPAKKVEPTFVPNKDQKKAEAKVKELLDKAKGKTDDPDMINYLNKEAKKVYETAKMPEDQIKKLDEDFEAIRNSDPEAEKEETEEVPESKERDLFNGGTGEKKEEEAKPAKPAKAAAPKKEEKKAEPAPAAKDDDDDNEIF